MVSNFSEAPGSMPNQDPYVLPDIASTLATGCRDTGDLTVEELWAYSRELSKRAPEVADLTSALVINAIEGAPIPDTFDMLVHAERAVADAHNYPAE